LPAGCAVVWAGLSAPGCPVFLACARGGRPRVGGGPPGGPPAVAVIAVMAAAGVGARGHAHHQHRRNEHTRCPHGPRPPLVPAGTTREGGLGVGRCGGGGPPPPPPPPALPPRATPLPHNLFVP